MVISVVGNEKIKRQESEGFMIRFGDPPEGSEVGGVGANVRAFSEGLIELESREVASRIASEPTVVADSKGFVLLRPPAERERRQSFKVFRPSLIAEVEQQWTDRNGAIGHWKVKVRGSGDRAEAPHFEAFDGDNSESWNQTVAASRNFAKRFSNGGGVGQIYDDEAAAFRSVNDYLRAWAKLLEVGEPSYALANTVEVQSLSGRTIGLIVLPAHPLRVAWHAAYDNLVLHTAFNQNQHAKAIREEFAALDGAMFPTFLPKPGGGAYVFADTLGFHAVGMVPDADPEPKAAVAILARSLGEGEFAGTEQMVGNKSAKVLEGEIAKYLNCHDTSRLLHVHALRAGDGFTVAKAFGGVQKNYQPDGEH